MKIQLGILLLMSLIGAVQAANNSKCALSEMDPVLTSKEINKRIIACDEVIKSAADVDKSNVKVAVEAAAAAAEAADAASAKAKNAADATAVDALAAAAAKAKAAAKAAEDAVGASATNANDAANAASIKERLKAAKDTKEDFLGLNWALGLAFTSIEEDSIEDAVIENGIVRVKETAQRTESLMFETHYTTGFDNDDTVADGPFVAIELTDGEGEELKAYGFGWMWSFQFDSESKRSVNIGVGYYVNKEVRSLASGFVDGEPVPTGYTDIQYREDDERGWMVMLSHTFW